ncbi:MAG: biopolymer transporter ExbD [Thermoguttaceae bacterium]|jgi:biopolymer transport protein ExbD
MSATQMQKIKAEPNLTPILDMVLQLITFFILVINFGSKALDMDIRLPVVGSARPVDTKGLEDLLILNITQDGKLIVYGIPKDIESFIVAEAQATLLWAWRTNPDLKLGDELPSMVVIRADKATPFKFLNRVIKACQENGYRRFVLKTKIPER